MNIYIYIYNMNLHYIHDLHILQEANAFDIKSAHNLHIRKKTMVLVPMPHWYVSVYPLSGGPFHTSVVVTTHNFKVPPMFSLFKYCMCWFCALVMSKSMTFLGICWFGEPQLPEAKKSLKVPFENQLVVYTQFMATSCLFMFITSLLLHCRLSCDIILQNHFFNSSFENHSFSEKRWVLGLGG